MDFEEGPEVDGSGGSGETASTALPRSGIELEGLTRRYAGVSAVHALSLSISPGEFFTLLGPSGCGKSTTLRMVAGLEDPTSGRVRLGDRDVTSTPPERRDVSMVFQDYALFPHMNVLENVRFPLRMKHVPRAESEARVREMLAIVGLAGMEDRRPDRLSGGERQRAALARSLVWRPKALLLDEPLAALDYQLRQGMQTMLKELQRRVGITFLFVTHDQTEAFAMSDRLGIMRAGRLEQVGTPRELYERPESLFAATFIGRMNLIEGRVATADGGRLWVEAGGVILQAPSPHWRPEVGARVLLGVRPESIAWTSGDDRPGGARNALEVRVTQMTFQGSTIEMRMDLPGGKTWRCVRMVTERVPAPAADGRLTIAWDPERSHVFEAGDAPPDPATGTAAPEGELARP